MQRMAVFGSGGTIGAALVNELAHRYPNAVIFALSRAGRVFEQANVQSYAIDYLDEHQLASLATRLAPLDMILIATGVLHDDQATPEKSIRQLSVHQFMHLFEVNTLVPAMITKHFAPVLSKEKRAIIAALSARIGSISDNRLGGWYAYRASKAALNMFIKTLSIELSRTHKHSMVVGLHPGTVDSPLTKPFQSSVPAASLFTPHTAASQLVDLLSRLTPQQTGRCFAFDGEEIAP